MLVPPDRASPYEATLGERFLALHPHVRRAHQAPLSAEGAMDVVHGQHVLTPLLVRMMKLPSQGKSLPVVLQVTNEPGTGGRPRTMSWRRQIGSTVLNTRQFARAGRLVEETGAGAVEFALQVDSSGGLHYADVASRVLALRLPRFLAPRVRAQVSPTSSGWRVEVVVEWRGHLVCQYGGAMHLARSDA